MKFQLLMKTRMLKNNDYSCFHANSQMLYLIIFICIIMPINVKMPTMLVPEMYERENIHTFLMLHDTGFNNL